LGVTLSNRKTSWKMKNLSWTT